MKKLYAPEKSCARGERFAGISMIPAEQGGLLFQISK